YFETGVIDNASFSKAAKWLGTGGVKVGRFMSGRGLRTGGLCILKRIIYVRKKLELAQRQERYEAEIDAMRDDTDDQQDKLVENAQLRKSYLLKLLWSCSVQAFRNNGEGKSLNGVIAFRNNCEVVMELKNDDNYDESRIEVSGHTNGVGINGETNCFFVWSYMETLLLPDESESIIYY
ncbi:hypothetical protein Tco_1074964, partial [Tanacetum coccineum]